MGTRKRTAAFLAGNSRQYIFRSVSFCSACACHIFLLYARFMYAYMLHARQHVRCSMRCHYSKARSTWYIYEYKYCCASYILLKVFFFCAFSGETEKTQCRIEFGVFFAFISVPSHLFPFFFSIVMLRFHILDMLYIYRTCINHANATRPDIPCPVFQCS